MLAGAGLFLTIALSEPTNLTIQEDRRKTVSVAIIQGSITKDQYDMADASYSYVKDEIKRAYVQLTLMELNEVDLVVWPETALHDPIDEQDFSLLGVKHYNAASSFTAGMTPTSTYRKNNLLPITESKFTPGIKASALKTEFEKMAVLICFEAIYKSYVEQTIKKDVSMVVVLSNDSGFGRSLVSYYMLKQAMLIAVSQNKHVIRASQAGVSAFINPNGSITKNAHSLSESC
jgi:apolipoprotein N-acyltransferase